MQNDIQENRPAPPPLSLSIDIITRSTASAVLIVYALGFVILGFHDARYGVVQFSPFRARIVLVGFVFAALVTLAAGARHYRFAYLAPLESVVKDTDPSRRMERDTVLTAGFIFTALVMANVLGMFLIRAPALHDNTWRWRVPAFLALYGLGFAIFAFVNKTFSKTPLRAVFLSLGAFAILFAAVSNLTSSEAFGSLAIIFALVGWHGTWIRRSKTALEYAADFRNWASALLILWLYISQVFSSLPPRWGGGQPTPVVIFQNAPAPWSPSNPMDALLLDETDQGLYVLLSPNGKAFFVPRGNVASIFFGSKEDLTRK
jgi:hypothetical protein